MWLVCICLSWHRFQKKRLNRSLTPFSQQATIMVQVFVRSKHACIPVRPNCCGVPLSPASVGVYPHSRVAPVFWRERTTPHALVPGSTDDGVRPCVDQVRLRTAHGLGPVGNL